MLGERAPPPPPSTPRMRGCRSPDGCVFQPRQPQPSSSTTSTRNGADSAYLDWTSAEFPLNAPRPEQAAGVQGVGTPRPPGFNTDRRPSAKVPLGSVEVGQFSIDGWRLDVANAGSTTTAGEFRRRVRGTRTCHRRRVWSGRSARWHRQGRHVGRRDELHVLRACHSFFIGRGVNGDELAPSLYLSAPSTPDRSAQTSRAAAGATWGVTRVMLNLLGNTTWPGS